MTKVEKQQILYTYATFLLNGVLALSLGSLLPFIREEFNLSYAFAGLIVSLHSIGNFISSFFAGTAAIKLGRKRSILLFNICFAISYVLIIFGKYNICLALAFLMTGLARGASSNFANTVVNNIAPGKASYLNALHAMFSVGALTFPIILTLLTRSNADNWIASVYMMIAMGVLSFVLYYLNPVPEDLGTAVKNDKSDKKSVAADNGYGFFKEPLFYLVTFILFFYLCAEQGVIGWLVTYFIDTGLLGENMSQLTSSIMWAMMLIGRLSVAYLSSRVKKEKMLAGMSCGVVLFFFWLIITKTPAFIVVGIMGFGLSMAGIYATTVSFAGKLIQKYSLCWSFILTLASLGSVLMPVLIGAIAEKIGILAGMSSVLVVVIIDFVLIIALCRYLNKEKYSA